MIQVAILAGGLGTRMRPFTETVPKPMITVLGRPFLDHLIDLLKRNGARRFVLLVSYLGHVIQDYLGDGSKHGIEVLYSYEHEPLGTGGALKNAAGLLEGNFLVVHGDTLLDIDYQAMVADFEARQTEAMIAAYFHQAQAVPSNLAISPDGTVVEYVKQRPTGEYVDAGVVALRKSILDLIPSDRKCSLEQEVFPTLIASGQMKAWKTQINFYDMGTPSGLASLEAHLR